MFSLSQATVNLDIDKNISIALPKNYDIKDTAGLRIITALIDNGMILITRTPNKGEVRINIEDEDDLVQSYKGMEEGMLKATKGTLVNAKMMSVRDLKLDQISYRAKFNGEQQFRSCLLLVIDEFIYTIQIWQLDLTEATAQKVRDNIRDNIFASVHINPKLTHTDQLIGSDEESRSYKIGYFLGELLGYGFVFGAIILIIIFMSRKAKKKSTNP